MLAGERYLSAWERCCPGAVSRFELISLIIPALSPGRRLRVDRRPLPKRPVLGFRQIADSRAE